MEVSYNIKSMQCRKGIFAARDIAKGTLVREIGEGVNTVPISGQKHFYQLLNSLGSEVEKVKWIHHCYDVNGTLHEIIDDSQHIHHENGEKCNIARSKGNDSLNSYATKDIKAGEEIIEDYQSYRWSSWMAKLCRSFQLKIDNLYQKLAPGVAIMQIKYQVKEGKYGMGIFVDEDIKKGTLIWKYNQDVNVRVICKSWDGESDLRQYLTTFPSYEQKQDLLIHMYCEHGYCHQLLDDCQFWNHSDNPNTGCNGPDPFNAYALRDIQKGEELLDDYGTYEWPDWYLNLLVEYGVDVDYFTVHDKNKYKNLSGNGMVPIECN